MQDHFDLMKVRVALGSSYGELTVMEFGIGCSKPLELEELPAYVIEKRAQFSSAILMDKFSRLHIGNVSLLHSRLQFVNYGLLYIDLFVVERQFEKLIFI